MTTYNNDMDGQNTNRPMGGSMKDKTFILFFTGPFSVLAIMVILFSLFLYHITEGTNFLIMPSSLQLWGSICICCIADIEAHNRCLFYMRSILHSYKFDS